MTTPTARADPPRRRYRRRPLIVQPAAYVPMTCEDEARLVEALAELLAPLFIGVFRAGESEQGPMLDS